MADEVLEALVPEPALEDQVTPAELDALIADEPGIEYGPQPEVLPKKERKIFKGEQKPLGDLDGQRLRGTPVQVITRTVDGAKIPGLIILDKVGNSYKNHYTTSKELQWAELIAWDPRQNMKTVVYHAPRANVMNLLTGRMGEKLRAEFAEWQSRNLNQSAPAYPMYIGTDPEIFVVDKDGQNIPAWQFLPEKKHGLKIGAYSANAYWDGFQAEYTTPPGVSCLSYFADYVREGLKAVQNATVAKHAKAKLSIASVLPVDPQILQDAESKYVEFGCMPSKNAYGLSGKMEDARRLPLRFAGGHIHFGMYSSTAYMAEEGKKEVTRLHQDEDLQRQILWSLDSILGVACVSLFEKWDNPVRREFYGLPGEYRLPPHGLEYRTLSNAWLAHPVIMNLVYELGRRAFSLGWFNQEYVWKATEGEVLDCIIRCDAEVARAILKRNEGVFKQLMSLRLTYTDTIFNVFMKDMSATIKDPADIAGNWLLNGGWTNHNDGAQKQWRSAAPLVAAGTLL